jgi:hypothetical protein
LRVSDSFSRVFGRKFSHHQCQFAVGCHPEGCPINALHIGSGTSFAGHSYNEPNVGHIFVVTAFSMKIIF